MQEDQELEVEALKAIYADDFDELEGEAFKNFTIKLAPFPGEEEKNKVGLTLEVKFTPLYPNEAPQLYLRNLLNISTIQAQELEEKIKQQVY